MILNKKAYTQAWVLQCKSEGEEFTVWAFNDELGCRLKIRNACTLQMGAPFTAECRVRTIESLLGCVQPYSLLQDGTKALNEQETRMSV